MKESPEQNKIKYYCLKIFDGNNIDEKYLRVEMLNVCRFYFWKSLF